MLAEAMFVHGLDRRLAFTALASPFVGTSARRLLVVYGALTTVVSMWVSNTATTAMMFPIGMALVAPVAQAARPGDGTARRFALAMMLVTSIAATVGGLATPVGAPPNLIGFGMLQRLAGVRISFLGWMAFAVPIVIVLFALVAWAASLGLGEFRLPAAAVNQIRTEREALGPLSPGQRNVAIAFGCAVVLWMMPGVLDLVGAENLSTAYTSMLPEGVAAILGASLLFVLPTDWRTRRFTLTWEEAVRIDWGIVLLYGGGMALGELAFSTGLATAIGQPLVHGAGTRAPVLLVAVFTAAGIVLSQVTSNTAAAAILVPVAIAACGTAGVPPLVTVLGATFGSSLGIVLPISSASNAIVYSSGHVPIRAMTRAGILLDVVAFGVILVVLVGLA
jgi:sodium-dependent dicarboxylate transporter 2/3/5